MKLIEIRATAEGRTQLMAVISSEANLRQLDGFKEISARLAKATGLTNAQARELLLKGGRSSGSTSVSTPPRSATRKLRRTTTTWWGY